MRLMLRKLRILSFSNSWVNLILSRYELKTDTKESILFFGIIINVSSIYLKYNGI